MARRFVGTWGRTGGDLAAAGDLAPPLSDRGKAAAQILGGRSLRARRSLKRVYLRLIHEARSRILIAHAYIVPERAIRRALIRAARRGVTVDLLLPGRSDVPLVRWATRAEYGRMLAAGARIRELRDPVLHAKVAIFDGEALATGSANLDSVCFGERPIEAEKLWRTMFDQVMLEMVDPKTALIEATTAINEVLPTKKRYITERTYNPPT